MLAKLVQQYHLKIFFSSRFLHAAILDKITNKSVVSANTNSAKLIELLGELASKNDERACTLVGRTLAAAAKTKNVSRIYWDGEVAQKTNRKDHRAKAEILWQSLAGSGVSVARKEDFDIGDSPFLPQEVEFPIDDEGYGDGNSASNAHTVALVKVPQKAQQKRAAPKQPRRPLSNVAPQFRQQMWKLTSKRAQIRRAVRKATEHS
ncbi:hypothetical protein WJX73_008337 [Symbiochloris irregularis]|uniref:Uncharacterized protein n=1 Tax=Symbiochloris irregularis TaxID=706552 RepID=A0AAW1NQI2_9CHLO